MSEQRREDVLRAVQDAGRIGLADLAAAAGVSKMTVRRDLDELTRRGLLRRVRGGAVSLDADPHADPHAGAGTYADLGTGGDPAGAGPAGADRVGPGRGRAGAAASGAPLGLLASPAPAPAPGPPPSARPTPTSATPGTPQDRAGLERAARAVAEAVPPGATVLLDAGPGAAQVAAHLAHRAPLTVAVTSLECAVTLAASPGVRLVVLGGEPRPGESGLLGPAALTALGDLHLDVYVMTPAGLDATGVWVRSPDAAALARTALAHSDRTIALVGVDALGRRALMQVAPLHALAQVVTPIDRDLGAVPVLRTLSDSGTPVHLA